MEEFSETEEDERNSLGNSYFIAFFERKWFYGSTSLCLFVLLDKKGQILWSKAKQPSDPELKKDLDQLFD